MSYIGYDLFEMPECAPANYDFIENLEKASHSLDDQNTFAHFDLNLPSNYASIFEQLEVNPLTLSSRFDKCLNCDDTKNMIEDLVEYLSQSSSSDISIIKDAAEMLFKLSMDVKKAVGKPNDYTLLQVRLDYFGNRDVIDDGYEPQNWHYDELYYSFGKRVIVTLKGYPTSFYKLSDDERVAFDYLLEQESDIGIGITREESMEAFYAFNRLIKPELISHPKGGQGTIFTNGYNNATLHATPTILAEPYSTRLIVIVDVGNADAMKSYVDKIIEDVTELAEDGITSTQDIPVVNYTPVC